MNLYLIRISPTAGPRKQSCCNANCESMPSLSLDVPFSILFVLGPMVFCFTPSSRKDAQVAPGRCVYILLQESKRNYSNIRVLLQDCC